MLILLPFVLLFIGLIYFVLYKVYEEDTSFVSKKFVFISVSAVLLSLLIYYIYYLKKTIDIRTWDLSCYWMNTIKFSAYHFFEAIKELIRSINNDEYNLLPSFILQPIFYFTNKNFNSYVLSIFAIYVIPCIIAFTIFISKCNNLISTKKNTLFTLAAMLAFILLPQIHNPVLSGYLDIARNTVCFNYLFNRCEL